MQVPGSRLASGGVKSRVYLWSLPTNHDEPVSKILSGRNSGGRRDARSEQASGCTSR